MPNYFIIGGDGKEYGPITEADIRLWISEGRLNAQTSARTEAETTWRPLGTFPEFAAQAQTPPTIAPPGTSGQADDILDWEAAVLAREPELKIGECLASGFSFLSANAGFLIGAVLLAWISNLVLTFGALYVPLLGALAMLALNGVVMGGFYFACLRRMRGEKVSPVEVFCGFQKFFVQLLLVGLVGSLLTELSACCFVLPMIYLVVAWAFGLPLVTDKKMFFWSALELSRKIVTRIWFEMFVLILVAYLPFLLVQIYNMDQAFSYYLDLYHQTGGDLQLFAKQVQANMAEVQAMSQKEMLIGQAVMLVNMFYLPGVLMRAYENLFGKKS